MSTRKKYVTPILEKHIIVQLEEGIAAGSTGSSVSATQTPQINGWDTGENDIINGEAF